MSPLVFQLIFPLATLQRCLQQLPLTHPQLNLLLFPQTHRLFLLHSHQLINHLLFPPIVLLIYQLLPHQMDRRSILLINRLLNHPNCLQLSQPIHLQRIPHRFLRLFQHQLPPFSQRMNRRFFPLRYLLLFPLPSHLQNQPILLLKYLHTCLLFCQLQSRQQFQVANQLHSLQLFLHIAPHFDQLVLQPTYQHTSQHWNLALLQLTNHPGSQHLERQPKLQ